MNFKHILKEVEQYYTQKVEIYGTTAQGVDWNSSETQALRFEQLLKVGKLTEPFSINDYGCGYGALVQVLIDQGCDFQYRGYDLSPRMIDEARGLYSQLDNCVFYADESLLTTADYTLASGIFNVKQNITDQEWLSYILDTLDKMAHLSRRGFAFNVLTSYSDQEYMRSDLYYADPSFLFDYCKKNFSRFVALLHDYPLYEFTILVKY